MRGGEWVWGGGAIGVGDNRKQCHGGERQRKQTGEKSTEEREEGKKKNDNTPPLYIDIVHTDTFISFVSFNI